MENNFESLVSVITPNYNGERFLMRALETVAMQDYSVEHIVVDDCSTDSSWEQLQLMAKQYPWVIPLKLEQNSGPVVARNRAIELAKGRFLAFLDVDDFWLPQKLATQIQFMLDERCALSFSDYRFVTEDGRTVGRRLQGYDRIGWHLHHMTRYLGCLTIVVDRGKFPDFQFPDIDPGFRAEDFLAWSHCIINGGPAMRCPHDLARYSIVSNSRSSNARRAAKSVWKLYRDVEGISLWSAAIYFIVYACGVAWKRYWFRPSLDRKSVDSDFEWSILH